MATPRSNRNPLFLGRWFDDEIIVLCVRWYISYKLSYRDLCEMMVDRGLAVSYTTLMRWSEQPRQFYLVEIIEGTSLPHATCPEPLNVTMP